MGEGDDTALPANSTPIEPFPVTGSYGCSSGQTRSDTQEAWLSPARKMVLSILFSYRSAVLSVQCYSVRVPALEQTTRKFKI